MADRENRNGATSYKMKDLNAKAEGDEGVDKDKEKEEETKTVGILEVFRFANGGDVLMMFVGALFASGNGIIQPLLLVVFGAMIDFMVNVVMIQNYVASIPEYLNYAGFDQEDFMADTTKLNQAMCDDIVTFYQNRGNFSGNSVGNCSGGSVGNCSGYIGSSAGNYSGNVSRTLIGNSSVNYNCPDLVSKTIMDMMTEFAVYYCILGCLMLICAYFQLSLWLTVAERQAKRIRHACLMNILRQDIGWFDTNQAAELNTKLSNDVLKMQEGIGDKVGAFFQWTSGGLAGFTIGFYHGWKLAFVTTAISPAIAFAALMMSKLSSAMSRKEQEAYGRAGGVAEEVFSSIRTVVAFGGQEKEARRYNTDLEVARQFGVKKGFTTGLSMAVTWFIMFSTWGVGFWYGGKLHRDEGFEVGNLTTVFFSMMIGAFSLGNVPPSIQAMSAARGAAYGIFKLIDQKSRIDSLSNKGEKPPKVTGLVQLRNVHFSYPARPDVKVLSGVSLDVQPGQTVALVGASGCGKTTVVQLLMRFYDIQEGQILIDGKNIKSLNIKWLRKSIGLVSQEPVLFATTIAENIQYGRQGVTMEEIVEASKKANAYNFIMELPDKFNTLVGERGAQLSGGQKQRIAIARALVRDPKILLLDEATSALDTESEGVVQDALDKARQGRTTLIIAHRLSTIKTSDIIIGLDQGQVKEVGSPEDLMARKGIYYTLSMNQMRATEQDQNTDDDVLETQDKPTVGEIASRSKSWKTNEATDKDNEEEQEIDEDLPDAPFGRLIRMNAPEFCYILLGCLASAVNGCMWPAMAVILTKSIYVFAEDDDTQKKNIMMYSLMFVGLGVVSAIVNFFQNYMFACSGEALTLRIRDLTFRSMMKQEIAWFDDARNGVGALTTRLSTDASQVQGVTGHRLGSLFMSLMNIAAALGISFYHGWMMTLVVLGFLPLTALGGFMQAKLLAGQSGKNKEAMEEGGKITVESIGSIRTVASLSQEQTFVDKYMANIRIPFKSALRSAQTGALLYGFSQCVMFFSYAASFVFGGYLVEDGQMEFENVFLVFGAIVYGAIGLGNASAFAPDLGKAQTSAKRIIKILDSKPTIDHTNTGGTKLPLDYEATLTLKNVKFHYASRADVPVLQGLDITVNPGQTLALVGTSGCGKTTTVQLIERFYDCINGSVVLGDFDIKTLNIQWLRSQLGLVSQEPILFNSTIGQNIAYGDNSREVKMDEIIAAAKEANIHKFISSLPQGYSTNVGSMGTQLSGGQKQRIAIARALIRNPKILLLDEATSALDTESEKIVQEALEKARVGRTCVVIAHRLSTVQNADKICVVSEGRVTEAGTHQELMALEGTYYKLVNQSQRQAVTASL